MDAGVALSVWEATEYFAGVGVPVALGSAHRMNAPYQAIACADGYITLGVANDAVEFTVVEGDLIGLIGPNGSGKTTLINMLTGHLAPDGGEVVVRGKKYGIATPVNARVRDLVWELAKGKRRPGLALLRELHAQR